MRNKKVFGAILLFIEVLSIGTALIFTNVRANTIRKMYDEILDLGDLVDHNEDHAKQIAEILAVGEPHEFGAREGDGTRSFYFVVDERYNHIVFMTSGMAKRLTEQGELLIQGVAREFTSDIRQSAVDWMAAQDAGDLVTLENFREMFGNVWLDATASPTELTPELNTVVRCGWGVAVVSSIAGLIVFTRMKKEETD